MQIMLFRRPRNQFFVSRELAGSRLGTFVRESAMLREHSQNKSRLFCACQLQNAVGKVYSEGVLIFDSHLSTFY